MSSLPENNNYIQILQSLKEKIRAARQKAALSVNVYLLQIYWEIGNTIAIQEKEEAWGAKVVETLSHDLKSEFPDMKGFSLRNLRYMRDFALAYPGFPILQPPLAKLENEGNQDIIILQAPLAKLEENPQNEIVQGWLAQLSWYHHITILDKIKDKETRFFYIHETVKIFSRKDAKKKCFCHKGTKTQMKKER